MGNPVLIKALVAEAAVLPYRVVKFGSADGYAVQAAAATDTSVGLADNLGQADAGDTVDVIVNGVGEAEAGAAVTRGARLTSDASGRVVAAASGNAVIGVAMASATAAGDIIPVNVAPSMY
ncbi:DUF2190 family protein [Denitromonas halophila]|uniref:DUF2190 family protein n=1 Tax=Denitromonas halophila TaxID=1629404 RepID=A0A557QLS0_9RHOO|nr:DUF2190 family protein [Denitromonas halophila]TVO53851.1 DUF2190 family protein [Denitromonas halophila]